MEYPELLLAIRASGMPQYKVARLAQVRESRLSEISRRGGASIEERRALSRALGIAEVDLFKRGHSPQLIDTKTAAALLGISVWTVRRLIDSGALPTVKIPATQGRDVRRILIDRTDIERVVQTWKQQER